MSRFENETTGVVVNVDDSKDDRFGDGWKPVAEPKATTKKSSSSKTK